MPTPIEILFAPESHIIFIMFGALILWEAFFPARKLTGVNAWKIKGLVSFISFFYISTYLPLIWDQHLAAYQLFDLSHYSLFTATTIGLLTYELAVYVWHRSLHKFNILWRGSHQMHHSIERLDSVSAFWFSPLDMIGWTFLGSIALVVIVGLDANAASLVIYLTTFFSIYTHCNIKTPYWSGFIIQRPEAHRLHHAKNIHAKNYSDIAFFDLLFGTFENPKNEITETGFYPGASSKVFDMLVFKDISNSQHSELKTETPQTHSI